jgi:hypothetical protein
VTKDKSKEDRKFNLHVLTFAIGVRDQAPREDWKCSWSRAIKDFEFLGRWSPWVIRAYLRHSHFDCCVCGATAVYRFGKEGFCSAHKEIAEKKILHARGMRDRITQDRWQKKVAFNNPHTSHAKRTPRHIPPLEPPVKGSNVDLSMVPKGSMKGGRALEPRSGLPYE